MRQPDITSRSSPRAPRMERGFDRIERWLAERVSDEVLRVRSLARGGQGAELDGRLDPHVLRRPLPVAPRIQELRRAPHNAGDRGRHENVRREADALDGSTVGCETLDPVNENPTVPGTPNITKSLSAPAVLLPTSVACAAVR